MFSCLCILSKQQDQCPAPICFLLCRSLSWALVLWAGLGRKRELTAELQPVAHPSVIVPSPCSLRTTVCPCCHHCCSGQYDPMASNSGPTASQKHMLWLQKTVFRFFFLPLNYPPPFHITPHTYRAAISLLLSGSSFSDHLISSRKEIPPSQLGSRKLLQQ